MKYYSMVMDKRIKYPVLLRDFPTGESMELHKEDAKWLKDGTILQTIEDENSIYADLYEAPIKMVSDKVGSILKWYVDDFVTRRVSLMNGKKNTRVSYQLLLVDRIPCLHETSEFYKDQSVKRLVLDAEKIKGNDIFRMEGIRPDVVVVSMRIAESVLRRKPRGILFQEMACFE